MTQLKRTPVIQQTIDEAINYINNQNLKTTEYVDIINSQNNADPGVSLDAIKKAVQLLNSQSHTRYFYDVIKGSDIYFQPPPPKPRNAKLEARLVQLRKQHADMEYADSVANITTRTRKEAQRDPFSSYKGQMGIGLDLIVTMFTLFVLFYSLASFYYPGSANYSYHLVCGLIGLVIGLIIDAILLIIRSDHNDKMIKRKEVIRGAATSSIVGRANYKGESVTRFLSEKEKLSILDSDLQEQKPTGVPFKL
jgi:hypothetical protein